MDSAYGRKLSKILMFCDFDTIFTTTLNFDLGSSLQTDLLLGIDGIFIFGILALVASFMVYPLPETHKKRLTDTLGEAEGEADDVMVQLPEMKSDSGQI